MSASTNPPFMWPGSGELALQKMVHMMHDFPSSASIAHDLTRLPLLRLRSTSMMYMAHAVADLLKTQMQKADLRCLDLSHHAVGIGRSSVDVTPIWCLNRDAIVQQTPRIRGPGCCKNQLPFRSTLCLPAASSDALRSRQYALLLSSLLPLARVRRFIPGPQSAGTLHSSFCHLAQLLRSQPFAHPRSSAEYKEESAADKLECDGPRYRLQLYPQHLRECLGGCEGCPGGGQGAMAERERILQAGWGGVQHWVNCSALDAPISTY